MMVSPPEVWPPSSAYKLQPPWKMGVGAGNDEAPAVAWGGGWWSELLWPMWRNSGPSTRIPWVVGVGQGDFSSRWQESRRPPGTSLCAAGPPVAGPRCWAWAEREKEGA